MHSISILYATNMINNDKHKQTDIRWASVELLILNCSLSRSNGAASFRSMFLVMLSIQNICLKLLTWTWPDINWLCEDGGCGWGDCWLVGCVGGDGLSVEFWNIAKTTTRTTTAKTTHQWISKQPKMNYSKMKQGKRNQNEQINVKRRQIKRGQIGERDNIH